MNNHICQECSTPQLKKETESSVQEVYIEGVGLVWLCKNHNPYRTSDPARSLRIEGETTCDK